MEQGKIYRGRPCGGGRGHVEDLARLADLRDRGAISDEEYQRAKDKLLM